MIEAIFISDLHLHPMDKEIAARFDNFLAWLPKDTRTLYILGDFLHVWFGDDAMDLWSLDIARKIRALKEAGIQVYYMHGNRDFLLSDRFTRFAGWEVLQEPAVIRCGDEEVLLVHGDGYCTKDIEFQKFRRITRSRLFCTIFKHMPLELRLWLVNGTRAHSGNHTPLKSLEMMDVVEEDLIADMQAHKVRTLIHGHTHKQGLSEYSVDGVLYRRYVMSDWDDNPVFLCYDRSHGFYFSQVGKLGD